MPASTSDWPPASLRRAAMTIIWCAATVLVAISASLKLIA